MSAEVSPPWRLPLLVAGFVCLVTGVLAGLARLGWAVPAAAVNVASLHGALMVSGFFGTVIGLERAVALRHPAAYLGPLLSAAGGLALVAGVAPAFAPWLMVAASSALTAASIRIVWRQPAAFTLTLALGAAAWLAGNTLWALGAATQSVLLWWMAFLVLTIAGERLELSRMLPRPASALCLFGLIVVAMLAGLVESTSGALAGPSIFAAALLGLAAWLMRHDIARRTVKQSGLTRFIAVCLLSGYGWLATGALVALSSTVIEPGAPAFDASVHAVMLGFVFSMVLGHAPIILPAVMRVRIDYRSHFYLPLLLLHASLALRIVADGLDAFALRRTGALINGVALLAFILTMAHAVWRSRGASGTARRSA